MTATAEIAHGTVNGYRRHDCRCPACTRAERDYHRAAELRRLYNLSVEDYGLLLVGQRGRCAICGNPPGVKDLAVDHDHKTGLIRGLVCWPCNKALRAIRESAQYAADLVAYLVEPPAVAILGESRYGRPGRVTARAKRRKRETL